MRGKERFIEWYLGTSDQEIRSTYESLGRMLAERLAQDGGFTISITDLVRQSDMEEYFEWLRDQDQ